MNLKRIEAALIPHGYDRPQMIQHQWIFIFLLLVILVTLPCYESRETNKRKVVWKIMRLPKLGDAAIKMLTLEQSTRSTPSTQKLISNRETYQLHKDEPLSNYIKDDWEGDLRVEQSNHAWDSISMQQQKENIYVHEFPSVNFTYNHTRDNQLLVHNKQSLMHKRFKRGVIHLYNMVVCATGCNPLAYKGYGCYCGFLGSGYVIDGIDKCCKMHDWCYDATECPMFSEYFVPYYWRCYHGYKPVCAVEHGNWGGSGSCAQRLCECDRSFAECLKRYPCPTTKAVCTSSPWRLVQNLFMIM